MSRKLDELKEAYRREVLEASKAPGADSGAIAGAFIAAQFGLLLELLGDVEQSLAREGRINSEQGSDIRNLQAGDSGTPTTTFPAVAGAQSGDDEDGA